MAACYSFERLLAAGLIERRSVARDGRPPHIRAVITEAGRAALAEKGQGHIDMLKQREASDG